MASRKRQIFEELVYEVRRSQAATDRYDQAVADAIAETGATSARDIGRVMKAAMAKLAGQSVDGSGWLACGTAAMGFDPICGDGTGYAVREGILGDLLDVVGDGVAARRRENPDLPHATAERVAALAYQESKWRPTAVSPTVKLRAVG